MSKFDNRADIAPDELDEMDSLRSSSMRMALKTAQEWSPMQSKCQNRNKPLNLSLHYTVSPLQPLPKGKAIMHQNENTSTTDN
uniref:Uncharacterized protein n=1 Tax=Panagrellus redivivus TaxID=6233 RepID=A0A7E4UQF4_PANRE